MITPIHVDEVWSEIEPQIRKLLDPRDEPDANAVRRACLTGQYQCLRCNEGVVLIRILVNPYTGVREMLVRWGSANADAPPGAFERTLPEISEHARKLACARLIFHTSRRGWLLKAIRAGWRLRNIELVLDL